MTSAADTSREPPPKAEPDPWPALALAFIVMNLVFWWAGLP